MKSIACLCVLVLLLSVSQAQDDAGRFIEGAQAAYTQNDQTESVLQAYRAWLAAPRDPAVQSVVRQLLPSSEGTLTPVSVSDGLATFLTIREHSLVAFVLLSVLSAVILLQSLLLRWKAWLVPVRILLLLALTVSAAPLALRLAIDTAQPRAVTTSQAVSRVGPGDDFLALGIVRQAQPVRIMNQQDNWVLVVTRQDQRGWIPLSSVVYVIPPDSAASE